MRTVNMDWIKNEYNHTNIGDYPCTLDPYSIVMCSFRDGTELYSRVNFFDWIKHGSDSDIMKYRVLSEQELKELNKKYERTLKSIVN